MHERIDKLVGRGGKSDYHDAFAPGTVRIGQTRIEAAPLHTLTGSSENFFGTTDIGKGPAYPVYVVACRSDEHFHMPAASLDI